MSMKRKNSTPKKELESRKQLDTGKNAIKELSFDNQGTCMFCYIPFKHTTLLQRL